MNDNQKAKKKFRQSAKWLKFRKYIADKFGKKDAITGYPLRKGWNLHHILLDETKYEDITVEDNFIPLNKLSHDFVHWIYKYYVKDKGVIERIVKILDKMIEINS